MNMLPAIRAYCEERIAVLTQGAHQQNPYIISELRTIVRLCDGLDQQAELVDRVLEQHQVYSHIPRNE